MTTAIVAEPVDLTEHVLRSLRGWLHRLFPDIDVYIERNEGGIKRPAFRLEVVSGPGWIEAAQGMSWLTLTVMAHYAAAEGDTAFFELARVTGKIRANAVRPQGRIPMNLYNLVWPQPPTVSVVANGGTLPAEIDVAVAAIVGAHPSASAPGEPLWVHNPVGVTIGVTPRNWPSGGPLATQWEVYSAEHGQPLTLQGTCAPGDTFELVNLVVGAAPPSNRRIPWQGIRVDSLDVTQTDVQGAERIMDAGVTIRLRALSPRTTNAQMDTPLT